MSRGYFGIGVENMKNKFNYGTLYRSAYNFNADFIFMVGRRFKHIGSDTVKAYRHIPLFEFHDGEEMANHLPYSCPLIGVEIAEDSHDLISFIHPERAAYILGPEDGSLSPETIKRCHYVIQIPTNLCLNVAVAGSIIMYDRMIKNVVS